MPRVAVYGTLKHGHCNHDLLIECKLVGALWIEGYTMHSLGAYPAVTRETYISASTLTPSIWCEVYEVPDDLTQARLDRLEGYPHLYQKEVVDTIMGYVTLYTMQGAEQYDRITNGEWQNEFQV